GWSRQRWQRPFPFTTGLDYEVSDERRLGNENFIGERIGVVGALRRDERNRVTARDVYVQADWEPAERWRVNIGARHSRVAFDSHDHVITDINPDDRGAPAASGQSPGA